MRRLFRQWDKEGRRKLSLQNLVNGFAAVRGTRDIMENIAYFFDLYDDESDGKVDRDGILKMSEAFLFLGRRGLPDVGKSNEAVRSPVSSPRPDGDVRAHQTKEEQFLSAVSAFIRRCFEYADPDGIGDDEDEDDSDLIDLGAKASSPTKSQQTEFLNLPPVPSETKPNTHAANLALDPANPLFISLATFRMVILADETLESFFDTGFANTFHLADQPIPASSSSLSNLTTFANLGGIRSAVASASAGVGAAVVGAPGLAANSKGLRGFMDGIVNDGMRVAGEVRRRMEDMQRELDSASVPRGQDGDEDDDEDEKGGDHDLLGMAEATALGESVHGGKVHGEGVGEDGHVGSSASSFVNVEAPAGEKKSEKLVEFEQ
jgi:TBC1 domain family member 8/9